MSDFIIEITDPQTFLIEIETNFIDNINNIEIERSESFNIDIINSNNVILASDLPNNIPMNKIVGNLDVTRIDNLDDYLNNYNYLLDCGTP